MTKELTKRIMKRVYAIWFFKKIVPAVFLYLPFLLFVAVRETANEFFVVRIIDNFLLTLNHSGFFGVLNYLASAIANTPVLPSLIILVSLGVFALVLRRLTKSVKGVNLVKSY